MSIPQAGRRSPGQPFALVEPSGDGLAGAAPETVLLIAVDDPLAALQRLAAYHRGLFTPTVIGLFQDRGMALGPAMALCIALAGVLVIAVLWMGPETRGRHFHAAD